MRVLVWYGVGLNPNGPTIDNTPNKWIAYHQQKASVLSPNSQTAEEDDEKYESPCDDEDVGGEFIGNGGKQRHVLMLVEDGPQTHGENSTPGQLEHEQTCQL